MKQGSLWDWKRGLVPVIGLAIFMAETAVGQVFVKIVDPANPILTESYNQSYTGCAWVDYDSDGWLDLFATDGNGIKQFKNNSGVFTAVANTLTADNTFYRGLGFADYDNDGDFDVFVVNNLGSLYRNDGADFTKVASNLVGNGDNNAGWSPAWGDYDNDGYVDLVITFPNGFVSGPARANRLLRNLGPPNYELAIIDTGVIVTGLAAYTSGNWSDYDMDGDLDLFIGSGPAAAGQSAPDDLYQNMLIETGMPGFDRITMAPIATDLADGQVWNMVDIDNDGDFDMYRTNWGGANADYRGNDFYVNDGGTYTENPFTVLTSNDISLSSVWGDFDNDGDLDCYVANINPRDRFYANDGSGGFSAIDAGDLGDDNNHTGASAGDYDNDGDLDVYAHGTSLTQGLYRNDLANGYGWLKLKLEGQLSNRAAIGAKVRAKATIFGQPVWQIREISAQNTFLGHNSLIVHFGFGDATAVDSIQILWPSGEVQDTTGVPVNQLLQITESCVDSDLDGFECDDNCPTVANADQSDTDGDGIGDVCDDCPNDYENDSDHDGYCADVDNCLGLSNPDQADSDGDGVGDLCDACPNDPDNDADADGLCADADNCPDIYNPGQEDLTGDGIGDLCCCVGLRGDINGDGANLDIADLTSMVDYLFGGWDGIVCPYEADVDGDGGTVANTDINDLTFIVEYLFGASPDPVACP